MERGASVAGEWERERLLKFAAERGGRLEAVERSWVVGRGRDGVAAVAAQCFAAECRKGTPYARCDGPCRPDTGECC